MRQIAPKHEGEEHPHDKEDGKKQNHPIASGTNGDACTIALLLHGDAS